ncbi:protein kinase domain-containing protein [Ditylenchus destructor]|uniref:Protein kinase domain-containing protein n=1 Tax=Ditylenchus destructor TaxID=166010 RepID=A0AAD4N157_9BILA|nr:protein kinase domain-containing protein [Ditylenchus destructor]
MPDAEKKSPSPTKNLSTDENVSSSNSTTEEDQKTTNTARTLSPKSAESSSTLTEPSLNWPMLESINRECLPELTAEELNELTYGVNRKEVECNTNFDTRFYKNQIAMRQHNLATRPVSPRKFEPQEEEGVEYTVIAKYVAEPDDKPCYLTVRQSKHMGSGRFSDVFSGSITIGKAPNASAPEGSSSAQNTSSFPVAIKKIWPDKSREDLQIITHRLLCHHNVVKLIFYYACVHPSIKSSVWVMILEPMPSNLEQEFAKYKSRDRLMPRIYVKLITYQLMSGLAYMERKRVLHRDIKPENLLVDMNTGVLKIGDFGSSKLYETNRPSSTYIVTRYYRAPELCLKYRYYDCTIDVWSAGCILVSLLTNKILFYGRVNLPSELIYKKYPPADWFATLYRFNKKISKECADFISRVLRYESNYRLRGNDALNHDFFNSLREPGRCLPNGNSLPKLSP